MHKDSIDIATADAGRDGEVRHVGGIGGDLAGLDKALRKLVSKGCRLHVVYEAGPCGFVIWRHLSAKGIECEVVAPSSIPRLVGDGPPRSLELTTSVGDVLPMVNTGWLVGRAWCPLHGHADHGAECASISLGTLDP